MEFSDVWKFQLRKTAADSDPRCISCGDTGKCYDCHGKVSDAWIRDLAQGTRTADDVPCDTCNGTRRCGYCGRNGRDIIIRQEI